MTYFRYEDTPLKATVEYKAVKQRTDQCGAELGYGHMTTLIEKTPTQIHHMIYLTQPTNRKEHWFHTCSYQNLQITFPHYTHSNW